MRFIIILILTLASLPAVAAPKTVILVRHAEKAASPANDPALTTEGRARADLLAAMLSRAGVTAIFSSEFQRTRLTVEPLSRKLRIPVTTVPAKDADALLRQVMKQTGVIVIVGHSNTLPALIQTLGGPLLQIEDQEYDRFFVLANPGAAGQANLLELRYAVP